MITLDELTNEKDFGRWVVYNPQMGRREKGRIKEWSNKFIFVVYKCDDNWEEFYKYTGCATRPQDLEYMGDDTEKT